MEEKVEVVEERTSPSSHSQFSLPSSQCSSSAGEAAECEEEGPVAVLWVLPAADEKGAGTCLEEVGVEESETVALTEAARVAALSEVVAAAPFVVAVLVVALGVREVVAAALVEVVTGLAVEVVSALVVVAELPDDESTKSHSPVSTPASSDAK